MLYHGTAQENLESIRSTRVLTCPAVIAPSLRAARKRLERVKHGEHVIVLRDQSALRPGQMELSLSLEDFVAELNRRVFFWPGDRDQPNSYGCNFSAAYRRRGENVVSLRVDFLELLTANPGASPYFCRFNSGAPRTSAGKRSPRGPDTFQTADEWQGPPWRVAEVSFFSKVVLPDTAEVWDDAAGWRTL